MIILSILQKHMAIDYLVESPSRALDGTHAREGPRSFTAHLPLLINLILQNGSILTDY